MFSENRYRGHTPFKCCRKGVGGGIFLEKLRQIIQELETMQRIDYAPGGYGYIILSDAIELLTMVHDAEACASIYPFHELECGK